MKTYIVAGHEFPDTVDACCVRALSDGGRCTRTWAEIEDANDTHVGQSGFAHISHLTPGELEQIRSEKKRREEQRERAYSATMDLGSGA